MLPVAVRTLMGYCAFVHSPPDPGLATQPCTTPAELLSGTVPAGQVMAVPFGAHPTIAPAPLYDGTGKSAGQAVMLLMIHPSSTLLPVMAMGKATFTGYSLPKAALGHTPDVGTGWQ